MLIDGTQGTSEGDGLVQCINQYGNIYEVRDRRNFECNKGLTKYC